MTKAYARECGYMKRNGKHAETIKIFLVDAFTKEIFRGNPAMVCILDKKIEDDFIVIPYPILIIRSESINVSVFFQIFFLEFLLF